MYSMNTNYEKLTVKMAINLANPPSWAASVLPALFAIAFCYASGAFIPIWKAVFLLVCCVLMQAAVNTLNDYFDYVSGTDSKEDVLEKNDAVLLYNNINPKHALMLGIGFLVVAAGLGVTAAIGSGWAPFIIGIIGGLCVIFYTGGKTPISSLPIGELISSLVMGGGIPLAIYAVARKGFGISILLFSVPFIIGIALIMMTNNTCDIEKDIKAGRKTLPTLLGRKTAIVVYRVLTIIWMFATWSLPMLALGKAGIFAPILECLFTFKNVKFLCTSPLDQPNRINQMKGILKANLKLNLIYIAFFAAFAIKVWVSVVD